MKQQKTTVSTALRVPANLNAPPGRPDLCEYEWCGAPAVHAEHWYEPRQQRTTRAWCAKHVPMSGHYEWCGDPCKQLLARLRAPYDVEAATWWAE